MKTQEIQKLENLTKHAKKFVANWKAALREEDYKTCLELEEKAMQSVFNIIKALGVSF